MAVVESPRGRQRTEVKKSQTPDGGWGWVVAFGRFYCSFVAFGMISSFGVLYMELIEYFNTTRKEAAWVGSLNVGLLFLSGPFTSILIDKLGVQKTAAIGTLLAFSGCFASWFATGLTFLYISLGVSLGIGSGMLVNSSSVIVLQYFDKRRSLAISSSSTGAGLASLVLPLLCTVLVEEYGWRGTLLITSGLILNCFVCVLIFIPPHHYEVTAIRESSKEDAGNKIPSSFSILLCNRMFSLYMAGLAISRLAYTIPLVHVPDLVMQMGFQKRDGANLLAIMGVSNTLGRIFIGWLGDFECVSNVFLQSLAFALAGAVSFAYPLLDEFYALAVAAILTGAGLGAGASNIPVIIVELVGIPSAAKGLGLCYCMVGTGSLISSPIAGLLFDETKTYNASFYMCGATLLLVGVIFVLVMYLQRHQGNVTEVETDMSVGTVSPPDTYNQQISEIQTQTRLVETVPPPATYNQQISEIQTPTMPDETASPTVTDNQQISEIQTPTMPDETVSPPVTDNQQISEIQTPTMPDETVSPQTTYNQQISEIQTPTTLDETVSPQATYNQQIIEIQTQTRYQGSLRNPNKSEIKYVQ